jgi:hypothetical protein
VVSFTLTSPFLGYAGYHYWGYLCISVPCILMTCRRILCLVKAYAGLSVFGSGPGLLLVLLFEIFVTLPQIQALHFLTLATVCCRDSTGFIMDGLEVQNISQLLEEKEGINSFMSWSPMPRLPTEYHRYGELRTDI